MLASLERICATVLISYLVSQRPFMTVMVNNEGE